MRLQVDLETAPWQGEFLKSTKKIKALSGASDTGKSFVCQYHIVRNCLQYPGSRWFATASTWTQTYRAVLEPMMEFMDENGIHHIYKESKHDGILYFKNGSRLEMYSEEKMWSRIRSREFAGAFIEEATIFKKDQILKLIYEIIRRTRQRNVDGLSPPKCPILMSMNPDLVTHPLYAYLFLEPNDNMYVKKLAFKDGYHADDKERENLILQGNKREIELFLHGNWGFAEGIAFILEDGIHVRDYDESDLDQFYITFDYGFSPDPMVYLLTSVKNGVTFIHDEYILYSTPIRKHPEYLDRWVNNYQIIGYTGETATGAGEVRDLLSGRYKIPYNPTTKKRTLGWTTFADIIDDERFVINPRCKDTIRSMQTMVWANGTLGIDCVSESEDDFDDPADAIRYLIMCPWIYNQVASTRREPDASRQELHTA